MDTESEEMNKLRKKLKKVAIYDMISWIILLILGIVFYFIWKNIPLWIWIIDGIVIILGIIYGATLHYAVEQDKAILFKVWFGIAIFQTILCVLGVVLAVLLSSSAPGFVWRVPVYFLVIIGYNIYRFVGVWKYCCGRSGSGVAGTAQA